MGRVTWRGCKSVKESGGDITRGKDNCRGWHSSEVGVVHLRIQLAEWSHLPVIDGLALGIAELRHLAIAHDANRAILNPRHRPTQVWRWALAGLGWLAQNLPMENKANLGRTGFMSILH